jgi:tetratricopeptide (TPR) repeat protein
MRGPRPEAAELTRSFSQVVDSVRNLVDPNSSERGTFRVAHLDDLDRVRLGAGWWRPVRRHLGVTALGVNAYTADAPGDEVIERHDELSPGAGGHEELYVFLTGSATFSVEGERIEAPAGTLLRIDRGADRHAVAREPDTTILVAGGPPGAALPVSPFEFWYAAQPAYQAGDYEQAIEIASAGLRDWPDNSRLNYQLACYHALAGHRDEAIEHLDRAVAADPSLEEWVAEDRDLDSIRDARLG